MSIDSIAVDLGSVDDQVTHRCTDGGEFTNAMGIWDTGVFAIVGGGRVSSWTSTGQGTWTRQFVVPAASGEPSGTLTLDLRHTPQR